MKILQIFTKSRTESSRQRNSRPFRPLIDGGRLEERTVPTVSSIEIPLELVNIRTEKNPEYKLGIYIGLGGGAPKLYEFDTGGKGFWAAYSTKNPYNQWWGDFTTKESQTLSNTYSSGNSYVADLVSTAITFYKPGVNGRAPTSVFTTGNVDIAQITKYNNSKSPSTVKAWDNAMKSGTPPLFGKFYGDFGAALAPVASSQGTNIYSVLPQIQVPGLDVGFTVHVGKIDGKTAPSLFIGVSDSPPQGTSLLPMNLNTGTASGQQVNFPGTGVPTYSEQVANANFEIRDVKTGISQKFSNIGWTLDTGAPTATIWQSQTPKSGVNVKPGFFKSGSSTRLRDNLHFKVLAQPKATSQTIFEVSARTGKPLPKIPLSAGRHGTSGQSAIGWNYVNTGFWTFTQYDVSFNLSKGTVGFSSVDTNLQG